MARVLASIVFMLGFFSKVTLGQLNVEVQFTVDSITTTTATLNWEASTSDFTDISYSISIEPVGPTFDTGSGDGSVFSSAGSTVVSSLNPGSQYIITVKFRDGIDTQDVSVYAFNAEPLKVSVLNVLVNNDNTVKLSWTPGAQSTQSSYKIRYESSLSGVPTSSSSPIEVDSPGVEYTINNLFPGAQYTFYIKTVSGFVESRVESDTIERLYPLAPRSLTLTTNNIDMHVGWVAPDSVISAYKLEYTKKGLTEWITIELDAANTSKVISGLVSGQNYTVRMFGISDNRESQAAITKDATLVPVITANMTEDVEGTSTNEAVISYNEETGNGVFDEYIFTINGGGYRIIKLKSDTDRVVRFSGLIPGVLYTISARTRSGEQRSNQKSIQVLTVPGKPIVLCSEEKVEELTIAIQRPDGGVSEYIIKCSGTNCEASRTISPSGNSLTSATYESLKPFNAYTFHVSVLQGIGGHEKTGSSDMVTCGTIEAAPDTVASFDLKVVGYAITLTWTKPAIKNGVIRNYVLGYIGTKKKAPLTGDNYRLSDTEFAYTFTNLVAGYKYTFTIQAVTVIEGPTQTVEHYFPILEPSVATEYANDPASMKPVSSRVPSETAFTVRIVNPFTDLNGVVITYSVVVATSSTELGEESTLKTWSESHKESFKFPYIAIFKCPDLFDANSICPSKATKTRRKRAPGQSVDITIGAIGQCATNTDEYCNGELKEGSTYYVAVRAYTETGLHTDTPFSDPITTVLQQPTPSEKSPEIGSSSPSFGPAAGGTWITVSGTNFPLVYNMSINIADITCDTKLQNTTTVIAITKGLPENDTDLIGRPLRVSLKANNTVIVDSAYAFTYKKNPVISKVFPSESFIKGGTILTVDGDNLDSVAVIWMEVSMILKTLKSEEPLVYDETRTTYATQCQEVNSTRIFCPTPVLDIPSGFLNQIPVSTQTKRDLYRHINIGKTNNVRSLGMQHFLSANPSSRIKRETVKLEFSNDGDILEFYIGFRLDGVREYENYTAIDIYTEPTFDFQSSTVMIFKAGERLLSNCEGCDVGITINDYRVNIGKEDCADLKLRSNSLSCYPPQSKPEIDKDERNTEDPQIIIHVGLNLEHFAGYLRYPDPDRTATSTKLPQHIIIPATVVPVIVVIIVIAAVCAAQRRRACCQRPE